MKLIPLESKQKVFKNILIPILIKAVDEVKVKETRLKNVLYREVFAIRFEIFMLKMKIRFYQNSVGWALKGFQWDAAIYAELDKSP